MATEPDPVPAGDDTVELSPARADEAWPGADVFLPDGPDAPTGDLGPAAMPPEGEPMTAVATAAPGRRRHFPAVVGPSLVVALLVALVLVGAGAWLAARGEGGAAQETTGGAPTVPADETETQPGPPTSADEPWELFDLQGMQLAEARTVLEDAELRVRVRRIDSDRPEGEVVAQEPAAGEEVRTGDVVVLTVSRGAAEEPVTVSVPRVLGLSRSAASELVMGAGFEPRFRLVESTRRAGTVVSQDPHPGADVEKGSVVHLEVARQASRIEVPGLVGLPAVEARSRLRAVGLRSALVPVLSESPSGTVVRQSPRAGSELDRGGTVTLSVSTGRADVPVPDVVGLDEASARQELLAAGFEVRVVDETTSDPAQDGFVLRQTPSGGGGAREGSTVTIVVARYA